MHSLTVLMLTWSSFTLKHPATADNSSYFLSSAHAISRGLAEGATSVTCMPTAAAVERRCRQRNGPPAVGGAYTGRPPASVVLR